MKRKTIQSILAIFFLFSIISPAQIIDPVTWDYAVEKISQEEVELIFTANIDNHWHLYSQDIPEGGPIPTRFVFEESSQFELLGPVVEITEPEEKYDPSFDMKLKLFSEKALFKQRVKISGTGKVKIGGYIEFMSCDDQRCLPPKEEDFELVISPESTVPDY